MNVNLHPTECNICQGDVIYTDNSLIYGRPYGSGKMYYCTCCHAYVGTHEPRPTEAYGILANKEMRLMKNKCHELFDNAWKSKPNRKQQCAARKSSYERLANELGIDVSNCHFGYFDMDMLNKAYQILQTW